MDIQCKFSLVFHSVADEKVYSCDVTSKAISNSSREVRSVNGQHIDGKCDQKVDVMYFPESSFMGFPQNLPTIFPQLISLVISNCRITELSRQDLVGLSLLQCLKVSNNFLTSLPNDLFMDTPNLRILSFYNNKIEKLSSRLLNYLNWNILVQIDFRQNVKIDEIFERGKEYILTCNSAENFQRKCHSTLSSFTAAIDRFCSPSEDEVEKKMAELLVSGEDSDFSILVDGVRVRVHKNILAQHSSVFLAMFNHDMEENRVNELSITDYSAEVVQDMVRYIYTGKVSSLDHVVDLYAISSQYWIVGLQQLCQETIIDNVDESNMIEVLRIGCMYSSDRLKQVAFKKISKTFSEKPLNAELADDPDKLQALIQLKRQYESDYDEIMGRTSIKHLE